MPLLSIKPYWQTTDGATARLYLGDVRSVLRRLPAQSVQTCVTSPPYWGLRDYGTGTWEGGDPDCDPRRHAPKTGSTAGAIVDGYDRPFRAGENFADHKHEPHLDENGRCRRCGARRTDRQIGSEARPDCLGWARGELCAEKDWDSACHVCRMVLVFREVRRVLRDDGTLWLNYGDSYSSGGRTSYAEDKKSKGRGGNFRPTQKGDLEKRDSRRVMKQEVRDDGIGEWAIPSSWSGRDVSQSARSGLSSGNLVGVPWRVALALQADGWVLRQDIIWHKPSPMPESVRNRCTKAHEHLFLLTKSNRYYYDKEPIRERSDYAAPRYEYRSQLDDASDLGGSGGIWQQAHKVAHPNGANKRSVWTVAVQGYPGAHFATFPPKLIEPCILAGTSERGACAECGAPWRRVTAEKAVWRERPNAHVKYEDQGPSGQPDQRKAGVESKTVGWYPTCSCDGLPPLPKEPGEDPEGRWVKEVTRLCGDAKGIYTVPQIVLDPFVGSGTTVAVAIEHGRFGWGIDLSEKYLKDNAVVRISGKLLSIPAIAPLVPRKKVVGPPASAKALGSGIVVLGG